MASELETAERDLLAAISDCEAYCCGVCRDIGRATVEKVAKTLRYRIAADRAEREERAKPIDAEWCAANGGATEGGGATWAWFVGPLIVQWHARDGVTLDDGDGNWTFLDVANRGDFGDLLRVLKGGA